MDDAAKAEADKRWNDHKNAIETLAAAVSELYEALGFPRKCRQINQLRNVPPAVTLGFVPPEARERLDALITASGLHLAKGNGPLGHGAYFSLLYDTQFENARIGRLTETVRQEAQKFKAEPPPQPRQELAAEALLERQMKRVEGIPEGLERERIVPDELKIFVEGFNSSVAEMDMVKKLRFLAAAIPFLDLPDASRNELLHTIRMMQDAENIGS